MTKLDYLIAKYGKIDPQRVWQNVKTLEELFHCNKEFIKNNLTESFYHYGELCPDSKPLIDDLLELHDYGVFTHGGQGGLIEFDEKYNRYVEQKPYLDCFIHIKHLEKLQKYLDGIKIDGENVYYIMAIIVDDTPITNIPQKTYNVTRTKNLGSKEWNYGTNVHADTDAFQINLFSDYEDKPDIYDNIEENYIGLCLTVANYNSKVSLEKILIEFLKSNS